MRKGEKECVRLSENGRKKEREKERQRETERESENGRKKPRERGVRK